MARPAPWARRIALARAAPAGESSWAESASSAKGSVKRSLGMAWILRSRRESSRGLDFAPSMHRPPPAKLQTTTLWYHPTQQYGDEVMGDPRFEGRTPAWVIWHLLQRYTRAGDLVVDPFCGGGTTLDVARSLGRTARGFDLVPARDDIERADARALPLEPESVDFFFLDPPYSTHLDYAQGAAPRAGDLGSLDAFEPAYFEALER